MLANGVNINQRRLQTSRRTCPAPYRLSSSARPSSGWRPKISKLCIKPDPYKNHFVLSSRGVVDLMLDARREDKDITGSMGRRCLHHELLPGRQ